MPPSEPNVYELLAKQIEGGFDRLDRRHSELGDQMDRRYREMTDQMRFMNGRVTEAHIKLAAHDAVLNAGTKRIEVISQRTHETANKLQSFANGGATMTVRQWLMREISLIVATVGMVIGVLKFFGMLP
jgi:hypothetical protein